jgi:site-specific recombinase XerD
MLHFPITTTAIPATVWASTGQRYYLYIDRRTPNKRAVFLSKHNTPLDERSVNYMVKKYVKKAGIKKPVSVHTLRHTCATHKADKEMLLNDLQAILGHRRLETTYKYLHLAKTSLRDQMEATAL